MVKAVTIQGDGVAACCCARLLMNGEIPLDFQRATRPNLPSLLLSVSTQHLLSDVFGDEKIFDDFPVVKKRIVLWRGQTKAVTLPHAGAVVPESLLLERLWNKLEMPAGTSALPDASLADWLILSSTSKSALNGELCQFGTRVATASAVRLKPDADQEACWMEALDRGWLFLLPNPGELGSLISVGDAAKSLLGESRLVASQIDAVLSSTASFPAYPRILDPLCGTGWLACGTSAMSFDPICGEGAGNAIREAILVAAALRFLAREGDAEPVLDHYAARLLGGFLRHLLLCRDFYSAGPAGEWWRAELSLLQKGIEWTQEKIVTVGPPRFRLVGFDLQRAS